MESRTPSNKVQFFLCVFVFVCLFLDLLVTSVMLTLISQNHRMAEVGKDH